MIEQIEPPSLARETWAVARAAFVVVAGALCVVSAGRDTTPDASPDLLAFQARASTLDRTGQATFRAIAEALPELEAQRVEAGAWPEPRALAAEGIAPFDRPAYTWTLHREGAAVGYLGRPRDGGRAFLVQIVEPASAPTSPSSVDETHHRLPDGRVVHVATWSQPRADAALGDLARPMLSGWIQYLAAAPRSEPNS